jgi:hypothetical protein
MMPHFHDNGMNRKSVRSTQKRVKSILLKNRFILPGAGIMNIGAREKRRYFLKTNPIIPAAPGFSKSTIPEMSN